MRNKWGIINSDIYNMDESGAAIGVEQKLKTILSNNKKRKNIRPKNSQKGK